MCILSRSNTLNSTKKGKKNKKIKKRMQIHAHADIHSDSLIQRQVHKTFDLFPLYLKVVRQITVILLHQQKFYCISHSDGKKAQYLIQSLLTKHINNRKKSMPGQDLGYNLQYTSHEDVK